VIGRVSLALVVASVAVAVPAVVQGQTVLGLRAGLNVATLDGDDIPVNVDSRVGLNIGGSVSVPISGSVGLLVGASYSQKGATLDGEDTGEDIDLAVKLDYIEIPALLTLTFRSEGPLGGRFFAGPAFAFEVGCEVGLESGGVEISADCDEPDDPIETESFDFGAVGGAGLVWAPGGSFELSLDVLYNYGLSSILEDEVVEGEVEGADVKNRTVTVQAGVGFPL
jgi:hypothetical protein